MRDRDRYLGCLIGGAVGDALGYAVEFDGESAIFARYGRQGIRDYALTDGLGIISDDTQMTLFTAAGLLTGAAKAGRPDASDAAAEWVRRAYIDWLNTQHFGKPNPRYSGYTWLIHVPGLHSLRAPGNTCLAALRMGGDGTPDAPINNSKGCGGVMRVAPAGLLVGDLDIEATDRIGARAAALTHGGPLGWLPGAALSHIVRRVSRDDATVIDAVMDAAAALTRYWPGQPCALQLAELLKRAVAIVDSELSDLEGIHALGEGWVGDEALAIAVFCSLRHPEDFEGGVVAAVNHRGDSDSTGAVAGNILGAKLGLRAIPEKYLEKLELRDVIEEVAEDVYRMDGGESADAKGVAFAEKYPGDASWIYERKE